MSRFCDECDIKCLFGYENIWRCISEDVQIQNQFEENLSANTQQYVSRLAPDLIMNPLKNGKSFPSKDMMKIKNQVHWMIITKDGERNTIENIVIQT